MDLSALGSTLPPGLADAERDMGDKFRAAALSITNLYKSSLGYTKQAYQVGYSACLSDVLSTVQSSIGAGQDATQTLSRLMDWAEARETAMAAFAAEEADETPSTQATPSHPIPKRSILTRTQLQQSQANQRPSSAPPLASTASQPSTSTSASTIPSSSSPIISFTPAGPSRAYRHSSKPISSSTDQSRFSPDGVDPDKTFVHPSSTPLVLDSPSLTVQQSSPSVLGPNGRLRSGKSPYRNKLEGLPLISTSSSSSTIPSTIPSTSFNPSLPNVQITSTHNYGHGHSAPSIGMKRPHAVHLDSDISMSGTEDTSHPHSHSHSHPHSQQQPAQTPKNSRSNKRRHLHKDKDKDKEDVKSLDSIGLGLALGMGTNGIGGKDKEEKRDKDGKEGKRGRRVATGQ